MALEHFFHKVSQLAQTGAAKVKELADEGVAKGKELSEIGKLKMENASEQDNIRKAYQELGQLYFATYGENPGEPFAPLCERVAAAKAKIAYNEERIEDIKAAGNLKDETVAAECEAEPCCDEEPCDCGCEAEEPCGENEAPACACECCCDEEVSVEESPAEEAPEEEASAEEEPKE